MKKQMSPKKSSILIFFLAVMMSKVISNIFFEGWMAQVIGWFLLVVILILVYAKRSG
jgi:hypothetical protein